MTDEVVPCEVLIVGGGPAGATAAALLAEQGQQVVGSAGLGSCSA